MDFSLQGLVRAHKTQMERAFQTVVQYLLQYSKLDVSLVRIGNVTDDTFHVTLEARAINTGPAKATVSPMTLDLHGPSGCFGQISLPQMKTKSSGCDITVVNQQVNIIDKDALHEFISSIMLQRSATLSLKNGRCEVEAVSMGPSKVIYEKDIPMTGMDGPQVIILSATCIGDDISLTLRIDNPSPMEISFGTCNFEIHDPKGEVFAELKGGLDIQKGTFETKLIGKMDRSVSAEGVLRLVGKRCAGAGWCHEAVKGIRIELGGIKRVLAAVGGQVDEEEDCRGPIKEDIKSRAKFWNKYTIR